MSKYFLPTHQSQVPRTWGLSAHHCNTKLGVRYGFTHYVIGLSWIQSFPQYFGLRHFIILLYKVRGHISNHQILQNNWASDGANWLKQ
jgi:hypothetical protein